MSNRFVDNVTPLNAATLNQFEEDMKQYADSHEITVTPANQTTLGGVKIWLSGTTLYISTT